MSKSKSKSAPVAAAVAAVESAPAAVAAKRGFAYQYAVKVANPPFRGLRVGYWSAVASSTTYAEARAKGGPAISADFLRWLHRKGYIAISGMAAPVTEAAVNAAAKPATESKA